MLDRRYAEPSVFTPENLLREARRQKAIAVGEVPRVCILDPDGDIVGHLGETGHLSVLPHWACYHTVLNEFTHEGVCFGIVGCAVGSSFAVLVAEQLFASGCELMISVTSAGNVAQRTPDAPFMLITSALRDEGTSVHYAPANEFSRLDDRLEALLSPVLREVGVTSSASWTTDAPYRETASRI